MDKEENSMEILLVAVAIAFGTLVMAAFLLAIFLIGGGEKSKVDEPPQEAQTSRKGDSEMFNKREDAFVEVVKQINDLRDELGLPRLPVETIHDAFGKMSKELLKQLEPHTGPIFKENVAGWLSLMLELVGKHNEDLGRLSIEENRWAIEHIKLRDAGKFAIKNLGVALDSVDQLAGVLASHGEEKAEDVRTFLRRRITYQVLLGDYLPKLPGAQQSPESVEAVIQEIIPLLPENEPVVIEGEVVEYEFGPNGGLQREREHWK
jgi:hypothetical protein